MFHHFDYIYQHTPTHTHILTSPPPKIRCMFPFSPKIRRSTFIVFPRGAGSSHAGVSWLDACVIMPRERSFSWTAVEQHRIVWELKLGVRFVFAPFSASLLLWVQLIHVSACLLAHFEGTVCTWEKLVSANTVNIYYIHDVHRHCHLSRFSQDFPHSGQ